MKFIHEAFKVARTLLAAGFVIWVVAYVAPAAVGPDGEISDGAAFGALFAVIVGGILWLIADGLLRVMGEGFKPEKEDE